MQGYCEVCRRTVSLEAKVILVEQGGQKKPKKVNVCAECNSQSVKPILLG